MHTFQRVINLLKNVNTSIRTYVICLILTSGRKNCAEMARTVNISQKKLNHFLSNAEKNLKEIEQYLFDFAKSTRNKNIKRTLVIDPSHIIKRYAQVMENLCYDKAGCTKNIEKTLVPVCASIIDQDITIPLNLDFWIQEKIIGKRKYKSKVKITQELILYLMNNGVEFDFVSLDGAFATPEMFEFFQQHNIKFIMRIPKNRCIVTLNGEKAQLKHIKTLKLERNSREKTIQARLKNGTINYFFTAQKRKKRNGGWETVFLVSNMNLSAKEHVASYNLRWPQEKINRTAKQKFGANQCQAISALKQKVHIMAGYLAYAIIEIAKKDKQDKSVDEVINFLRRNHFDDLVELFGKPGIKQRDNNIDTVDITLQNHVQIFQENVGESAILRC